MSTEQQVETQVDPDAAKYAELAKELGMDAPGADAGGLQDDDQQRDAGGQDNQQQQDDQQQDDGGDRPPKPTYEDLERNYSNTQTALKQARDEARQNRERLDRLMGIVEDARAQRPKTDEPKKDEPQLPDVQEDPIGHFTGRIAQLEEQLAEARKGTTQTAEQVRAQQQERQFWGHVQEAERTFSATLPKHTIEGKTYSDYDLAIDHLAKGRIKELEGLYPDGPVGDAAAQHYGLPSAAHLRGYIFNQDRTAIAAEAVQLGINPAERYYQLAKQRGYVAPNGAAQPDKGKTAIEAMKKGRAAATTISGGGSGRKANDELSMSDLADLAIEDPEAFDKMWDKMAAAGKLG